MVFCVELSDRFPFVNRPIALLFTVYLSAAHLRFAQMARMFQRMVPLGLPRNRVASRMCFVVAGSDPRRRARMKSAATGSSLSKTVFRFFCGAVQRAVAFHGDDGNRDNKVRSDRCADIENAFVDSCPVEDVFRPAVAAARD